MLSSKRRNLQATMWRWYLSPVVGIIVWHKFMPANQFVRVCASIFKRCISYIEMKLFLVISLAGFENIMIKHSLTRLKKRNPTQLQLYRIIQILLWKISCRWTATGSSVSPPVVYWLWLRGFDFRRSDNPSIRCLSMTLCSVRHPIVRELYDLNCFSDFLVSF